MNIIYLNSINPYYNLATEEYLLRNKVSNYILLYTNQASIIIGKHQNSLAEINHQYTEKMQIPVARRISGGGTVYHDLKNLNFSFVLTAGKNPVNFRKYSQPIVDFLNSIGVDAEFSERNDIFVHGKKVSGNAEHVFKNRVLHHGTLLFDSNLGNLNDALNVRLDRYNTKAVQSVRREVANISEFTNTNLNFQDFSQDLYQYLVSSLNAKEIQLAKEDTIAIQELANTKYETREWNFGYSPKYIFSNSFIFEQENIKLNFTVEKGLISAIELFDIENIKLKSILENFVGKWHLSYELKNLLTKEFDYSTTTFLIDNLV